MNSSRNGQDETPEYALGFDNPDTSAALEIESGQILVAQVLVETHPVLSGRVLVSGTDVRGQSFEQWLPCLDGLDIKAKDSVLVQRPANRQEALVTGVVESRHRHARRKPDLGETLTLDKNQSLRINDHNGEALVDITSGENGPSIQLCQSVAEMDIAGAFRLAADSLEFKARQGEMTLSASGDIKVDGEMIKLN